MISLSFAFQKKKNFPKLLSLSLRTPPLTHTHTRNVLGGVCERDINKMEIGPRWETHSILRRRGQSEAQPGKESFRGLDGCRKVSGNPRGWGATEWPRGESWGVAISKGPRVGRSTPPVRDWRWERWPNNQGSESRKRGGKLGLLLIFP